jgi:GH18 family chitinase
VFDLFSTLDLINVMAYDYHGAWAQYVHHNAPVYQHPLDIGYGPDGEDEFFNQASIVNLKLLYHNRKYGVTS